jgi:hypothetical protein
MDQARCSINLTMCYRRQVRTPRFWARFYIELSRGTYTDSERSKYPPKKIDTALEVMAQARVERAPCGVFLLFRAEYRCAPRFWAFLSC